eukprot:TRINITY_DN1835_c0_g1_i1.p1 TRINITY_DN1835_c0_g1~~TRINITY_DN1835_c0_g1_i1.p1  ORF type:complete len:299 (-),score=50.73 TRINITY_DN1835_c0_g1_i1:28-924(-)
MFDGLEDNWFFFLVFAGVVLLLAVVVLVVESKRENDDILKINPLAVLLQIFLNQVGFYAMYLLVTFSLDVAIREPFWIHQVFSSVEFSFSTYRGLFTGLALILSMSSAAIVLAGVVGSYKNMLDYCFTLMVIHFIVVSIVEGEFPASGAWWTALAIGLIFLSIFSERLSYHLETMSYPSHLNDNKKLPSEKEQKRASQHDTKEIAKDSDGHESEGSPSKSKNKTKKRLSKEEAIELPELDFEKKDRDIVATDSAVTQSMANYELKKELTATASGTLEEIPPTLRERKNSRASDKEEIS